MAAARSAYSNIADDVAVVGYRPVVPLTETKTDVCRTYLTLPCRSPVYLLDLGRGFTIHRPTVLAHGKRRFP
jgi:hypothetical protein